MVATLYTMSPVAFYGMGNSLHDPQKILSRNLRAIFDNRKLSVRGVADEIKRPDGTTMSNRTVQNMHNGTGAPQLDKMIAVAAHIHVPLWQLFCPGIEAGWFGEDTVHHLLEQFCSLSEIGRARFLQNLEDAVVTERVKRGTPEKTSA